MSDNIRQSISHLVMSKAQDCVFCAHDEQESCIKYLSGEGWTVINNRGLFINHGSNLHRAMGDLYAVTGIESDSWSIVTKTMI